MTKNTSIVLSEHFQSFIAEQVEDGRYGSASEVVRAGLRLLEDRETRLARLRAALLEGEQSGVAEEFDLDAFIADKAREEGLEE
ncbi:type II toxin-antitoxin system ParD family antitoxin [Caulobacter segnis]|jgi:antitoxin ParD1/3/4|uniref:type II toxin-antitoxin system ParD family antitoxin n=1 Tax=Caulobacter segnis TaxID=88688 RepID=UPI001CBE4033|nr:type II toxin-antitoxin system ParD family antitoxin [Caulobacter segnis]UAL11546.1 type II toxin-antitoxin system ParD family antitoxin [Caulobacter segnis]